MKKSHEAPTLGVKGRRRLVGDTLEDGVDFGRGLGELQPVLVKGEHLLALDEVGEADFRQVHHSRDGLGEAQLIDSLGEIRLCVRVDVLQLVPGRGFGPGR